MKLEVKIIQNYDIGPNCFVWIGTLRSGDFKLDVTPDVNMYKYFSEEDLCLEHAKLVSKEYGWEFCLIEE